MIKIIEHPFSLCQKAESAGLMVSMTSLIQPIRTELNKSLESHFQKACPEYLGVFNEDVCEDVLETLNNFIEDKNIEHHKMDFPHSSGSEICLLPITEHLQIKILIVDEYSGNGYYEKYIMIDNFIASNDATTQDVDTLIEFVQTNLIQ